MIDTQIQTCTEFLQKKNFDKLEIFCRSILKLNANDVHALYYLAILNELRYEPENGVQWSRKLLSLVSNEQTLELHGRLSYQANLLDEARDAFEKILNNDSNNCSAHYFLGCVKGKVDAGTGVRSRSFLANDYEFKPDTIYSAKDEQLIIKNLLHALAPKERYLIDIGAHDGITFSNSYALLESGEWSGVLVEPDRERASKLLSNIKAFPQRIEVLCGFANPDNLPHLIRGLEIPYDLGFVTVDIDSFEYEILKSLLHWLRPKLICVEINERIPPPIRYALTYTKNQEYGDMTMIGGCSIQMACDELSAHGYEAIELHYNNLFAVPKECFEIVSDLGYLKRSIKSLYSECFRPCKTGPSALVIHRLFFSKPPRG